MKPWMYGIHEHIHPWFLLGKKLGQRWKRNLQRFMQWLKAFPAHLNWIVGMIKTCRRMRASLHWGAPGRAVAHLGAVRLHRPRAPSPRALLHVVSPTLLLRLKTRVLLPTMWAQGHISAKLCTHYHELDWFEIFHNDILWYQSDVNTCGKWGKLAPAEAFSDDSTT